MAIRSQRSRPLALIGCSLALGAGGCGADDEPPGVPLPRTAVAELDRQLRSIENRYAFGDGACADIERDNRPAVRRTLERLSNGVDPDVRRALRQSFARLFELARRQCDTNRPPPATTAPAAPPPAPAPTDTAPADTAPTDTAPTGATDKTDTSPTNTSETSTSKTTPRAPAERQRTATQPNKPTTNKPPDTPSRTDSGDDSGGTPAPEPPPTQR